MNKIILLDSNSLINRAFYALPPLTNSKGIPTGAVYGFLSMLGRLINEENPTHIVATFDLKAPTFRHKMFEGYKSKRKPMPDELAQQIPILKDVLNAMDIKVLEIEGFEADDILGTIAKRFDDDTLIVTGDKDSFQLIDDHTKVYFTRKGISDVVIYDENQLKLEGLTPKQVIEYKALSGDASDNIPGIEGVGDKTAKRLLAQYDNLENLFKNAEDICGKIGEKIRNSYDIAMLSKQLATIDTNVPIECKLEDMKFSYPLSNKAYELFNQLEFSSLINRFEFSGFDIDNSVYENIALNKEIKTTIIEDINALNLAVNSCQDKTVAIIIGENITFSTKEFEQYLVAPSVDLFGGISYEEILNALRPLFQSIDDKILYDYKQVLHTVDELDITINGKVYDQLVLAHLVKGGKNYSSLKKVLDEFGFNDNEEAGNLIALNKKLLDECKLKSLNDLYFDIELPLIKVLYDMEKTGIAVDKNILDELSKEYTTELDLLTVDIYKHAGETFNINSPKQLSKILFETLMLPNKKSNQVKMSSNIDILNELYYAHPIVPLVIRYRQLAKLQSTYVDGLKKVIASDGRIHTDYKQTVTSTGRLSSTEPNLQNIPTRSAQGREVRRAFVTQGNKVLICADYSQIELRLLAHFSKDENLITAYKECRDIHASTASEIFQVPIDEVTEDMRRDAKMVNFGIIYGISDFGLANNLSIGPKQAKMYIERYFETYPKVKAYMDSNVKEATKNGYISTYAGRIRVIPEIKSPRYNVREFGKRAAMNLPLQGTAADIIKIAMIQVAEKLKDTNSKMLLQVHDELIVEAEQTEAIKVKDILIDCMENAVKLSVPLTVNVKIGNNWLEAD